MIEVSDTFMLTLIFAMYMLPTIIANNREHQNIGPIAVVNIFLGWTFVGWVIALAMSTSAKKAAGGTI